MWGARASEILIQCLRRVDSGDASMFIFDEVGRPQRRLDPWDLRVVLLRLRVTGTAL